jgi:hypothetical protein
VADGVASLSLGVGADIIEAEELDADQGGRGDGDGGRAAALASVRDLGQLGDAGATGRHDARLALAGEAPPLSPPPLPFWVGPPAAGAPPPRTRDATAQSRRHGASSSSRDPSA